MPTVRMQAPNGEVHDVDPGQVEHYRRLGATIVKESGNGSLGAIAGGAAAGAAVVGGAAALRSPRMRAAGGQAIKEWMRDKGPIGAAGRVGRAFVKGGGAKAATPVPTEKPGLKVVPAPRPQRPASVKPAGKPAFTPAPAEATATPAPKSGAMRSASRPTLGARQAKLSPKARAIAEHLEGKSSPMRLAGEVEPDFGSQLRTSVKGAQVMNEAGIPSGMRPTGFGRLGAVGPPALELLLMLLNASQMGEQGDASHRIYTDVLRQQDPEFARRDSSMSRLAPQGF